MTIAMTIARKVLALSGGVGGARLAAGLAAVLPEGGLSVVANTGDDFEHLGFHVSPDVDTLLYTLSGLNNEETGWGRAGETWSFLAELERLGLETWFRIGDRDLAVHAYRTLALRSNRTLTAITADLGAKLGATAAVVPMSDDRVRTVLETDAGRLPFQEYFVRRRCAPAIREIRFEGADEARPSPAVARLLENRDPHAIIICPSNPFLSIGPMLSIPGFAGGLAEAGVPIVAVTPVVGGDSIKGPTAKIMRELGIPVTPGAVAEHYRGLIDGFVVDAADAALAEAIADSGIAVEVTNTVMRTPEDRASLARSTLNLVERLRASGPRAIGR